MHLNATLFVHAHLDKQMDAVSIAEACEASPFHLSRSFRKLVGCAPWQYVSRMRVQLAAGLMKDGSLKLSEVAEMAGFERHSSFAATFKALQRVSPARFRAGL